MRAIGKAAHVIGLLRHQFVHCLAAVIVAGHAQFQNILEGGAGLNLVARQSEYFKEPLVDDFEPVLRVEQAKALRHVVERDIEAPVGLAEIGLLLLRQTDVAADDDEAAVAGRTVADAEPAPVGELHFTGRLRVVAAPGERPAGTQQDLRGRAQRGERRSRLQQIGREPEKIGGLGIRQRDAIVRVDHHDAFL